MKFSEIDKLEVGKYPILINGKKATLCVFERTLISKAITIDFSNTDYFHVSASKLSKNKLEVWKKFGEYYLTDNIRHEDVQLINE